jgi:hypothetical protein
MPTPRLTPTWRRFGLLLLLLGGAATAWIGWKESAGDAAPLQARFVGHGTNRMAGRSWGVSNLVFELRNPGIRPLHLRGHGKFSDWPLAEALSTHHLWEFDRQWFSTNDSPVIPPGGALILNVFAYGPDRGPGALEPMKPQASAIPTFIDTSRVWRFRFRARAAGPFDLIPSWILGLFPSEALPKPRFQETLLDVEMPAGTNP